MPKAFAKLQLPYTPKWKGNREREKADQVTIVLRDFPVSERINSIASSKSTPPGSSPEESIKIARENLEISFALFRKKFFSVENLAVILDDGDTKELKTAEEIIEHADELAMEVVARLSNGYDADEAKN